MPQPVGQRVAGGSPSSLGPLGLPVGALVRLAGSARPWDCTCAGTRDWSCWGRPGHHHQIRACPETAPPRCVALMPPGPWRLWTVTRARRPSPSPALPVAALLAGSGLGMD